MIKITAPINSPKEVEKIIKKGANELYCGVMPADWKNKYTNIASPNRREWASANLSGFGELQEVVNIAHANNVRVFFTVNTFYTEEQYPLILRQITEAKQMGVDAFIAGDLGLLAVLKKEGFNIEIHISNTGAAFNSETVEFYKELGAKRVILPRQLMVNEILELAKSSSGIEFEVFGMNSGCKNIDGFCTYQHGVSEISHSFYWDFFKKLHLDQHILETVKKLPSCVSSRIKANIWGIDSACLLNYKVSVFSDNCGAKETAFVSKLISSNFNLIYGADPCGACDLYRFKEAGITSIKIVGRNYSTAKKIKDVIFLKKSLSFLEQNPRMPEEEFKLKIKSEYRNIYKMGCNNLCYRY